MRRWAMLLMAAACARAETAAFRVSSDLVLVNATVRDAAGRPVTGLTQDRFQLFEGRRSQRIAFFTEEETPVSLMLVADVSRSMRGKLDVCARAAADLVRTVLPGDEFALVTFAGRPRLEVAWTEVGAVVTAALSRAQAAGTTAMFDALLLGAQYVRHARNARRVVLVVSDGGDNHSRYGRREARRRLEESGLELYGVGLEESPLLEDLCEHAAGRYVTVDDTSKLPDAISRISREIRSRYVLGYRPARLDGAGRFHRVEVQVAVPHGFERVSVSWRQRWREPE